MGLLPTARTLTFVPGDLIPSAILNEIEDCIIGAKHGPLGFGFFPTAWGGTGAPTLVANPAASGTAYPVWKFTATALAFAVVPIRIGSRLTSGKISLYGDGAVDVNTVSLSYFPTPAALTAAEIDVAILGSTLNIPASWQSYTMVQSAPQIAASGGLVLLIVSSTGANLHVGMVEPIWDRL
jgi:hypothetical protein